MLLTRKKLPGLAVVAAALFWAITAMPGLAQGAQNNSEGAHSAQRSSGPMEHSFSGGAHGRWWDIPAVARKIGLTPAQQKHMNTIFDTHRPQLATLHRTLRKDEDAMHAMMHADEGTKADENRILSQIDTIAQARANLEKADARMLFELRTVLTENQWTKLKELAAEHRKWMETHRWDHHWHHGRSAAHAAHTSDH